MNLNEKFDLKAIESIANNIAGGVASTIKSGIEAAEQRKANKEKLDEIKKTTAAETNNMILTNNGAKSIDELRPGDIVMGTATVTRVWNESDNNKHDCCGDCDACDYDCCNCDCCNEPETLKDIVSKVIFRNPYTIVHWIDGSVTTVKAHGEDFDPEKGFAMAFTKSIFGNRYFRDMEKIIANSECEMSPFNREVAKADKKAKKAAIKAKKSVNETASKSIQENSDDIPLLSPADLVKCPQCHHNNKPESKFCAICGYDMTKAEQPVETVVESPTEDAPKSKTKSTTKKKSSKKKSK